jgi:hypothetical protein
MTPTKNAITTEVRTNAVFKFFDMGSAVGRKRNAPAGSARVI